MRRARTWLGTITAAVAIAWGAPGCGDDDTTGTPECGNGVCETGETMESCPSDCAGCGNGILEAGEECDGTDFGGETCMTQGAGGGELFCNANCTINANYCCEHACPTEGETRCTGTVVESCEVGGEGCRAWAAQADCADTSEVCLVRGGVAACEPQCSDECPSAGDTQCSGTVIQTCTQDPVDACLYWVDTSDCADGGQICEDALGAATCTDSCLDECDTVGAERCQNDALEACQVGADGCNDWVVSEDCPANGELCNDSTGTPYCCADQCTTVGEQRCDAAGTGIEECRVGAEGCTEWQPALQCQGADVCMDVAGGAVCLAGGNGEDCSDLAGVHAGGNSVAWTASNNDYLTTTPDCVTVGSVDGPDVVLAYVASTDGYADVVLDKPSSTRWVMLASSATCGDVSNPMACVSDYTNTSMGTQFNIVSGQTYYLYVADTTSGSNPLDNPLSLTITETSCASQPAPIITSVTPSDGATAIPVGENLVFTVDQEIDPTSGVITITGTGGTNLVYDLSTNPPEVTISSDGMTVTVNPGPLFQLGETVTVTLSGIRDVLCHNVATSPPWSFTTVSQVGIGENCLSPLTLVPGNGSYTWSAQTADYFTSTPCGTSYNVDGPDVVGAFTATVSGNVTIEMTKPTSNRMFLAAYEGACGDLSLQAACENEYSPSTLSIQFPTVAGQTYYVYFADTTSGSQPLPNPLELNITEFDCDPVPAAVATVSSPADGATGVYPNEPLVVNFDSAVRTDRGVITITGSGGTNQSYDLATNPPEVTFSNGDQTMTIRPSPLLGLSETITVSWTGLQDAQCGKAIAPPAWSFTTAASVPPGEDCANPAVLSSGSNSVTWFATNNDYLTSTPACVAVGNVDGPDVVASYTTTVTGYLSVQVTDKPASTRWVAVVSSGACGSLTPEEACISEYTATEMGAIFASTAGTTYYIYLADTSSGANPLSNPVTINVTEIDCATYDAQPTALDPADGGVTTTLSPVFTATFPSAVSTTDGTVFITGDQGTNLAFPVAGPNVTFSSGDTVMEIDPAQAFPPGENLTISWAGMTETLCGNPVAPPAWGVQIVSPSCAPGVGGVLAGTEVQRLPLGQSYSSEYYVAVDADPNGWLYVGGTASLWRLRKAGGTEENVYTAAGLSTSNTGYAMLIHGNDIFVVDSSTTKTNGILWRISSDGGATWLAPPEDFAAFPATPNDDIRAVMAHGGRIYMVTHESSATTGTEIWSVSANPASLPDTAALLGTVPGEASCSGVAADDTYIYLACDTGDRVVRVAWADAPNFVPELVTDAARLSTTANTLVATDLDSDGTADVLYVHGYEPTVWYVCDPAGATPYTDVLTTVGSVNYGMAADPIDGSLWFFDDASPQAFVQIQ